MNGASAWSARLSSVAARSEKLPHGTWRSYGRDCYPASGGHSRSPHPWQWAAGAPDSHSVCQPVLHPDAGPQRTLLDSAVHKAAP